MSLCPERLNVVDFGADPTGAQPSGSSIQRAIESALQFAGQVDLGSGLFIDRPLPIVFLPPGIYRIERQLHLRNPVSLLGCGATLAADPSRLDAELPLIRMWGGNDIRGIIFHESSTAAPYVIDARSYRHADDDLRFVTDMRFRDCRFVGPNYPITAPASTNPTETPDGFLADSTPAAFRLPILMRLDGYHIDVDRCSFAGGSVAIALGEAANHINISHCKYSMSPKWYPLPSVDFKRTFVEVGGGEEIHISNNCVEYTNQAIRIAPTTSWDTPAEYRRIACSICNNYFEGALRHFMRIGTVAPPDARPDAMINFIGNRILAHYGKELSAVDVVHGTVRAEGNLIVGGGQGQLSYGIFVYERRATLTDRAEVDNVFVKCNRSDIYRFDG